MSATPPRQPLEPPPATYRVEMGKDGWYSLLRDGDDMVVCRRSTQSMCRQRAAELGLRLRGDGPHGR